MTQAGARPVFISYATEDAAVATAARDHLERRGVGCWMAPRDIAPGADYGTSIIEAISAATVMVIVLSRHADASPAVRREVERAFSKGLHLIPFKIEEFTLGKGLEFFLAAPQWLNAYGLAPARQVELLEEPVKAALATARGAGAAGAARPAPQPSAPRKGRRHLLVAAAAGAVVLAALAAVAPRLLPGRADLVRRAHAYELIQRGDQTGSAAALDVLLRDGSRGDRAFALAGKATAALARGDARGAAEFVAQARGISPECSLCDTVDADLLLLEGKAGEARARYFAALARPGAAPCEKAAAAAGAGRTFSAEGNAEEAQRLYAQALASDPGNSRALAGRAVLLGKSGKVDEALAGLQGHAADPYLAGLARALAREAEARRAGAQVERVRALVDDLVRAQREKRPAAADADPWTSRPSAVCFYQTDAQGGSAYHEGEDELLVSGIQEAVLEHGRFGVVERAELDRLLQELKLASSGLADPESALRLGRLRTAGVLVYTTAVRRGGTTSLSFKAVDTETSEILGRSAAELSGQPAREALQEAAGRLLALLARGMPLRGRVTAAASGAVELNIGSSVGVKEGMVLNLLGAGDGREAVGSLRVLQVTSGSARAEVVRAAQPPRKGDRVEAAL